MRSLRAITVILCLALLGRGHVQAARQAGQAPVSTLIVYVYAEVGASGRPTHGRARRMRLTGVPARRRTRRAGTTCNFFWTTACGPTMALTM
jgi:hypothetical protein